MADEIPSLLSLSRFGSKLDLLGKINAEGAKTPLHLTKTGGVPFFFRNLDTEFEDGRWREWPGVPGVVWWVLQRFVSFSRFFDISLEPSSWIVSSGLSRKLGS
jgi:hypothetical protein